jgi:DNA-binding NtrC family response regulator
LAKSLLKDATMTPAANREEHMTAPVERTVENPSIRDDHVILIVDDDTEWLADLQGWLGHEGLRVVGISRGEWVIEAVDFHEPDVVVLDVHLPGSDGLEILAKLRRRRPDIPVIIMTAFGGFDVQDRALMLGAAAYFAKPFRVSDLVSELRRLRAARPSP